MIIDDHPHLPLLLGRWPSGSCGRCGRPNDTHLSWGRACADRLGGSPLDYVRTVEDAGWTPPAAPFSPEALLPEDVRECCRILRLDLHLTPKDWARPEDFVTNDEYIAATWQVLDHLGAL